MLSFFVSNKKETFNLPKMGYFMLTSV